MRGKSGFEGGDEREIRGRREEVSPNRGQDVRRMTSSATFLQFVQLCSAKKALKK